MKYPANLAEKTNQHLSRCDVQMNCKANANKSFVWNLYGKVIRTVNYIIQFQLKRNYSSE